jgi:hypothetical protein
MEDRESHPHHIVSWIGFEMVSNVDEDKVNIKVVVLNKIYNFKVKDLFISDRLEC